MPVLESDYNPAMVNRVIRKGIGMIKTELRRVSLGHMSDILGFCFPAFCFYFRCRLV